MIQVDVIETSELGDRSYIAHDGTSAVVVDPQRDIDRVLGLLGNRNLTCVLVLETHIHNDYVTGGHELARRTGAVYGVNAADDVSFERRPLRDGDLLDAGSLRVRVISTPGHTDTHLAYVVEDGSSAPVVFTGGSLLFGSVGRTDLVDPARTHELTHAQYRSAHRLAHELTDETQVMPTHGFGSFCSASANVGGASSTIGDQKRQNDALLETDETAFVERLVAGLTVYPSYYAHMGVRNRQGPGPVDLTTPQLTEPDELHRRLLNGEWVVDLRDRTAYAAGHVPGTVSIDLGGQFSTYLGWLMPWGAELTLIGESVDQIEEARRQLVRIGIDELDAALVGTPAELMGESGRPASYRKASFADLAEVLGQPGEVVLDVRRDDERAASHLPGSAHAPLHRLLTSLDTLPEGRLWVHCVSGYRSAIAASLLQRAGREVVWIADDYTNAAGLR
ncbi:MBL fold metallo-hydrolase [Kineosporia sp. NBRC 101731]|uniref:MBL fold metallo-hydrolase n=1 Tax=Kineosporia sp. NBRC 101731 TaxID=3032199 RepID=UPI0024A08749|nr:MBL fold metallo-hydrolase [Kineosporia sp. NBRC 101731]GLY28209.1 MBL fold metallo-hydrolase [Kineosporia sp. NBRC 101731]